MDRVKKNVSKDLMINLEVGIDCAASQFFDSKKKVYVYKNRIQKLSREEQINYILGIAEKYGLFYIEDPLDEEDFLGFVELCKKTKSLVVGDDLTVTNLKRVQKAIKLGAITGLIIKPNQTGSLIEVRKIFNLCEKNCIKTIVSHRAGETLDDTIADIAFAFQADFIKTPIVGKEREAKVKRLKMIEAGLK
jgi:enolase